jgi:hypothetical protein
MSLLGSTPCLLLTAPFVCLKSRDKKNREGVPWEEFPGRQIYSPGYFPTCCDRRVEVYDPFAEARAAAWGRPMASCQWGLPSPPPRHNSPYPIAYGVSVGGCRHYYVIRGHGGGGDGLSMIGHHHVGLSPLASAKLGPNKCHGVGERRDRANPSRSSADGLLTRPRERRWGLSFVFIPVVVNSVKRKRQSYGKWKLLRKEGGRP